jgi:hypothetical protein
MGSAEEAMAQPPDVSPLKDLPTEDAASLTAAPDGR